MLEKLYYLVDRRPVAAASVEQWVELFRFSDPFSRVALAESPYFSISTVFLGIDHRHFGKGPPILFETLVSVRKERDETLEEALSLDGHMVRYSSWDDAEAGHMALLRRISALLPDGIEIIDQPSL